MAHVRVSNGFHRFLSLLSRGAYLSWTIPTTSSWSFMPGTSTLEPTPACSWGEATACAHGQAQPVTVIPGAGHLAELDKPEEVAAAIVGWTK